MLHTNDSLNSASFRDPSGFLFYRDDILYRQINESYQDDYLRLKESGLYESLCNKNLLVKHDETDEPGMTKDSFLVIKPELIPFISYPYEWSFGQLKDAALLTLEVQLEALSKGMSLKDASAYNVQFTQGKPVFIDTLSFEKYSEGSPWGAYRQFCQHFLAPLALMTHVDIRLNKLLAGYIDGVPLDLASRLLPFKTKVSMSLGLHLHLHAKQQVKSSESKLDKEKIGKSMSQHSLLALIDSLKSAIKKLNWNPAGTEWHDYYLCNNNYDENSLNQKEKLVSEFINTIGPDSVWDLGANDGRFSRIASQHAKMVVSWDIDPACVENNYRTIRKHNEDKLLPLLIDLTNPSPGIGWSNSERSAFIDRGGCDAILALGLVHHLAISNNLPFDLIAKMLSKLGRSLIIEFVPKSDSQVMKLLASRADIFPHYNEEKFESEFSNYYTISRKQGIEGTERTLYLMEIS